MAVAGLEQLANCHFQRRPRSDKAPAGAPLVRYARDARCSTAETRRASDRDHPCSEQQATETFAPYRPNQPFDDRVGTRHVRHGFDLPDAEDPQVRLPLMKPVQRIMVRTYVHGRGLAARRVVEHPAQRYSVNDATMHATTHDATCPVIRHDKQPEDAEAERPNRAPPDTTKIATWPRMQANLEFARTPTNLPPSI